MHIFIDESGIFTCNPERDHSISAVGALTIPTQSMKGFEKLYGRLRRQLPKEKGEVKGRLLSENQVCDVVDVLNRVNSTFEAVAIDMGLHAEESLQLYREVQAEKITANLTDEHHPSMVETVWALRRQLEAMPLQLFVQSVSMGELVYNTLMNAELYYAFRKPQELGEYHWIIDAKDLSKVTPWEEWWSTVILPTLESHSLREPFINVEGGDYRWQERYRTEPDEYKKQFAKDPEKGDWFDLKKLMKEDFRFSSDPEFGLEAVDILTTTIRRSMSGNFSRKGWISIPRLMIHKNSHYIRLISLTDEELIPKKLPYRDMMNDFRTGGRIVLPKGD